MEKEREKRAAEDGIASADEKKIENGKLQTGQRQQQLQQQKHRKTFKRNTGKE